MHYHGWNGNLKREGMKQNESKDNKGNPMDEKSKWSNSIYFDIKIRMQKNGSHRNVTLHGIMSNVYDLTKCFWFALTENQNWFLKRNVIHDSKFSPSSVFTLDSIFPSFTHSDIVNYLLLLVDHLILFVFHFGSN